MIHQSSFMQYHFFYLLWLSHPIHLFFKLQLVAQPFILARRFHLILSFNCLIIYSGIYLLVILFSYSFIPLFIYSVICSFIYLFIYLFTFSFIYSFIYSYIHFGSHSPALSSCCLSVAFCFVGFPVCLFCLFRVCLFCLLSVLSVRLLICSVCSPVRLFCLPVGWPGYWHFLLLWL